MTTIDMWMANRTTRQATADVKLDSFVFQVVCVAPVRDSFEWVNATLRLNVRGKAAGGNFELCEFRMTPVYLVFRAEGRRVRARKHGRSLPGRERRG